jgi:UDP-glucose 4-epimerase
VKLIVTGGCGFIGSNLVEELVKRGHDVVVVDDLSLGTKENVRELDVELYTSISDFFKSNGVKEVDAVFHLGMPSSSPMYRENPYLVGKTINEAIEVFESAKRCGFKVVYASTSSIYNGNPVPWRENMPIHVTDYYTECRYAMERLAKLYHDLYGVKAIGLRLFSVYGPKEEHKERYANVVTQMIWSAMKGEPFVIYGDGSQTRDFIYVSDVVEAFIKAMESGIDYSVFNVGFGKNYSFNEVAKMVSDALGKEVRLVYKPNLIKNYVHHTLADTKKAEEVLGFKAKIALREGVKRLIDYYERIGVTTV